jgi:hypothetical protein
MVKKNTIIAVTATSLMMLGLIGAVSYTGLSQVLAADSTGKPVNRLVQNLATKFGLDENAVQTVFDETRVQEQTDRLGQAVTDGKITEDQKTSILSKETETKTAIDAIQAKDLTESEKQTQIKAILDAQKTWMNDNNIPEGLLGGGKGRGMGAEGPEGGKGEGMKGGPVDSASVLQNVTDKLTSAVSAGTITEAQKAQVLVKANEVKSQVDAINNSRSTETEKRTQIRAILDAQKTWLTDNGISEGLLGGPRR